MSDATKPGSNPTIHHATAETRERTYERLRKEGLGRDQSRTIAEEVTRTVHESNSRRGR